ncbi:MAG TPA: creatininase family protein [Longimicrobiales bacterium]|nr:creatininase family protein [Longimicrobiales bacterium]
MHAARPYVLAETTWKTVKDQAYELAVLPFGATEAHNYHLPYGTDTVETTAIAAESARLAWEAGARLTVLPAIPFGVQSGQLDIPMCLHVNPSTQAALLEDIAHSVARHGVRKLVILNGHGGNDFRAMIRELQPRSPLFLCVVNWYACIDARAFFTEPGDHAGQLETALMMHLAADHVLPLDEAGPGTERRFRVQGLREGWAWAPRQWSRISADTGVGNPAGATAAGGAAYFAAVTERVSGFLIELASTPVADLYE